MISYFKEKGELTICEDSLTATVFDLLKYLPVDMFWNILKKSTLYSKLPKESGEIIEIKYWEKWNPKGTTNSKYVEPDVFIRFETFDLIIESKRYDKNQQTESQILKEYRAYLNEYKTDNKYVYILKMGGLRDFKNEVKENLVVCKSSWTRLLNEISFELNKLKDVNYIQINAYKRILEDLVRGLELHGFFKKTWLESLNSNFITKQNPKNIFNYATRN